MPTPTPTPTLIAPSPSRLAEFHGQLPWPLGPARLSYSLDDTWYWPDADDHYDRARGLRLYRDYARSVGLGVASDPAVPWDRVIAAAVRRYCGLYVVPNKGGIKAWNSFARGAALYYLETKDPVALDACRYLQPTVTEEGLRTWYAGFGTSRETAFMLDNALACELVGLGENPRVDTLAELALGHLAQWSEPAETRPWSTFVKPFMVGLSCLTLAMYREHYRATRPSARRAAILAAIPGALATCLDWLWDHCWIASAPEWPHGSFCYQDLDAKADRPPIGGTVVDASDSITFRASGPFSRQDGYYVRAGVTFTSGPAMRKLDDGKLDSFTVLANRGADLQFSLSPGYAPPGVPAPGDAFLLNSGLDPSEGPGPAPDVNHMIAPAYAYLYRETGAAKWRERYDAIFDGGSLSWGPPWAQKQWNETMYASTIGLDWRAAGVAVERAGGEGKPDVPPDEPTPVEPPRRRRFMVTMRPTVRMQVDLLVDGKVKEFPMRLEVDGVVLDIPMRAIVAEDGSLRVKDTSEAPPPPPPPPPPPAS